MLTQNERRVLEAFMNLIPKLGINDIDRVIMALHNEKEVGMHRRALVNRLMANGVMSEADAIKHAIEFQRKIEQSTVSKKHAVNSESVDESDRRRFVSDEDVPVKTVKKIPVQQSQGKNVEYIDEIEELVEELDIPENV